MTRVVGAGCGFMLLFAVGFGLWVGAMARRIAPDVPATPVSVAGDCPRDEALAWAEAHQERNQTVLSILTDIDAGLANGSPIGRTAVLGADLDVMAAFPTMRPMTLEDVPECVAELRDAEVERYGLTLRVGTLLHQGSPWSRAAHQFSTITAMTRGYAMRTDRVRQGYTSLGERIGEDLSEHSP